MSSLTRRTGSLVGDFVCNSAISRALQDERANTRTSYIVRISRIWQTKQAVHGTVGETADDCDCRALHDFVENN